MTPTYVIKPGHYHVHVRLAPDGTYYQRFMPVPEVQELYDLRREVAQLRAQLATTPDVTAAFRRVLGLSGQEASLLALLFRKSPNVVPSEAILAELYGHLRDGGPESALGVVRVMVHKLRKSLGAGTIENLHGGGYKLTDDGVKACRACVAPDQA